MISLKRLFTPVKSMDAEEARLYMGERAEGSYTLLDVRQPGEYAAGHIPGAKLIPLPELGDAQGKLDPDKPLIVYCAVGGRSRAAAQLLAGVGFSEVYNLLGGIKAWDGWQASGPVALNLDMVRGDELPAEIFALAYGMEMSLELFYRKVLAAAADDPALKAILNKLAAVEVLHKEMLFAMLAEIAPPAMDMQRYEAEIRPGILEGGFHIDAFLESNADYLSRPEDVLSLAMMLETQALDLYLRFADKVAEPSSRELLHKLANEEKRHLEQLARRLEANA